MINLSVLDNSQNNLLYIDSKYFSAYIGTPAKNIPPLDEFNEIDAVSNCRLLHFSSYISPSAAVSTIFLT